eukprot:SAG31_NODE_905_length_11119_cov_2.887931_9_plen_122_part_00
MHWLRNQISMRVFLLALQTLEQRGPEGIIARLRDKLCVYIGVDPPWCDALGKRAPAKKSQQSIREKHHSPRKFRIKDCSQTAFLHSASADQIWSCDRVEIRSRVFCSQCRYVGPQGQAQQG